MKATYLALCPRVQPTDPAAREDYTRKHCGSCGHEVWYGRLSILNPADSILCRECVAL